MRLSIFAALLFAGCTGLANGTPDADPRDTLARDEATTLADCTVIEALTKVPAAKLASFLPPGFEPAADATGAAFAIVGAADCAEGGGRAFVAIEVVPTEPKLLADGVDRYYWEPEHHVVEGGEFAAQVLAMGAKVTWADVTMMNAPTGASLRIAGDAWEHAVDLPLGAVGPGPEPLAAGVFREYFPALDGYGYFQASFAFEPTTPFGVYPATLTTDEGTVAHAIFGAESRPVAGVLETSFVDATVGVIPFR